MLSKHYISYTRRGNVALQGTNHRMRNKKFQEVTEINDFNG